MFGFFIIRKLFDISCISNHVQPISKPLSVVLDECGHFVVTWSQQNEAQKTRNFYINSLLIVQFNVPQKCYEFKPNTELLETCVNVMNTL